MSNQELETPLRTTAEKADTLCFTAPDGKEFCVPRSRVGELFHVPAKTDSSGLPWRVFRIMSEFVAGFEFLRQYDKAVSIFGTARCNAGDEVYKEAEKLGYLLAQDGFAVITGGGPGVMEAANKGASDAKGISVGINIKLPFEQHVNHYVKESESFKYFFTRKVMLSAASQVYIYFPGGYGTLDELFELLTLIQTQKISPIPVILIQKSFWEPLIGWLREEVFRKSGAINEGDLDLFFVVDTAEEAHGFIFNALEKGKQHIHKK
jgi:uncharacterized protein (TIGR00730 family)